MNTNRTTITRAIPPAMLGKAHSRHAKHSPSSLGYKETCPAFRNRGTTNAAAEEGTMLHEALEKDDYSNLTEEQLRAQVRPEFINRIDDIIRFSELSEDDIRKVVELQVERVHKMLLDSGIELRVTKDAVDYIAKEGYDPAFGARPVKRALQRLVLNELSKAIIAGKVDGTRPVIVELKDGELRFKN